MWSYYGKDFIAFYHVIERESGGVIRKITEDNIAFYDAPKMEIKVEEFEWSPKPIRFPAWERIKLFLLGKKPKVYYNEPVFQFSHMETEFINGMSIHKFVYFRPDGKPLIGRYVYVKNGEHYATVEYDGLPARIDK